jgi:hypothetical protein
MSAGKRFKFQGSTIAILSGYSATDIVITAVTKANPAVVTATGHGLTDGDVVKITEVVGMTELNDGVFIADVIDANTFRLFDVDSSAYGTYTSGGVANKATMSNWCELTGYNRNGGSSPEIPATSQCSLAQEFEIGLPDYGTTQVDYHFAPRTAVQVALHAAATSGEIVAVQVTLPKSGGVMTQMGFIQQESEQAAVNGLWTANLTIRNTGRRYDAPAA